MQKIIKEIDTLLTKHLDLNVSIDLGMKKGKTIATIRLGNNGVIKIIKKINFIDLIKQLLKQLKGYDIFLKNNKEGNYKSYNILLKILRTVDTKGFSKKNAMLYQKAKGIICNKCLSKKIIILDKDKKKDYVNVNYLCMKCQFSWYEKEYYQI